MTKTTAFAEIVHAFDVANVAGLTAVEYEEQWKRKDFIMLQRNSLLKAEMDGIEQGKIEGKVEVALRLIDKGMSVEEAAEVAGVSVEVLKIGV